MKKHLNFCQGVSFISEETAQITALLCAKLCVGKLSHDLIVILSWNQQLCNINFCHFSHSQHSEAIFRNGDTLEIADLNLAFMNVQQLQVVLRATQTLDVLIFFQVFFYLASGLKFTLSDVISFLPDNRSGLEKYIYSGLHQLPCNTSF